MNDLLALPVLIPIAAAGLVSYRLAQDPAQRDRPILARFREQLRVAAEAIDSGAASRKLADWVAATRR